MKRLVLGLCLWASVALGADGGPDAAPADGGADPALRAMVQDSFWSLAEARTKDGVRLFEAQRYPEALTALRAAYELVADTRPPARSARANRRAELTYNLAFTYQTLGNRTNALTYYRETLSFAPRHSDARLKS
jgi:tetratricopeptide (TPR) repeat protein